MLQKLRISEYINRLIAANGKIKLADAVARNYFQHNPSFLYTMYISDIIDILNSRCGRTYPEQLCVCLRIVVSNTYCVVFLFCLSLSMLPVFLDYPILIAPSVFSNVYLLTYWKNATMKLFQWMMKCSM